MKLVGLTGSVRIESYNTKLLKYIQSRYQHLFELEILDIKELPYYNEDEELNPPAVVQQFKQKVKNSDGVIIATPEYNWSVPGVLKMRLIGCHGLIK